MTTSKEDFLLQIVTWVNSGLPHQRIGPDDQSAAHADQKDSRNIDRRLDVDVQLDALSLVSSSLFKSPPSARILEEAISAVALLEQLHEGRPDEFGEIGELKARFAFFGWRHARSLGMAKQSQEWRESFDGYLQEASAQTSCLNYFLEATSLERSADLDRTFLEDPENLFALCELLKLYRNAKPVQTAEQAVTMFHWVEENFLPSDFQDEKNYFLAQLAMTLSTCKRWTGNRRESIAWLSRAEEHNEGSGYPAAGRCEIELLRLMLLDEVGHWRSVLMRLPRLQAELEEFGMAEFLAKSEVLEAECLKALGRVEDSLAPLRRALKRPVMRSDRILRVFALQILANSYSIIGNRAAALECCQQAITTLRDSDAPTAVALMKAVIGEEFRVRSDYQRALVSFRESRDGYERAGMKTWTAYARLLCAEALIALGCEEEARSEILAALPVIEMELMLPEAAVAVALLRESVRHRRTDIGALRSLREELQRRC